MTSLCESCANVREVVSGTGSRFLMCLNVEKLAMTVTANVKGTGGGLMKTSYLVESYCSGLALKNEK